MIHTRTCAISVVRVNYLFAHALRLPFLWWWIKHREHLELVAVGNTDIYSAEDLHIFYNATWARYDYLKEFGSELLKLHLSLVN